MRTEFRFADCALRTELAGVKREVASVGVPRDMGNETDGAKPGTEDRGVMVWVVSGLRLGDEGR